MTLGSRIKGLLRGTRDADCSGEKIGGVDVVLDDGSHMMPHDRITLAALFPRLTMRDVCMIEDMLAAYWPKWGGGSGLPQNVFHDLRAAMHLHDSIIVLKKDPVHPSVNSMVG